jgi:LytS/YehU family sensor histidine kinase
LNNIYALCEIDSKRAQQSVHYLSQLLRYILSGERSGEGARMVPVQKEHDFIKTFLQLIYLRMRPNVHVIYNADITEFSDAPVLTLIFTSLIENAFKHGVASGKECVIEFGLTAKSHTEIHFFSSNPYFQNHESNNPESGIGLENLRRRLDIVYKDDYKLDITNDGKTFRVDLTLNYTENNYYYNA